MLTVTEELILLLIDDQEGSFVHIEPMRLDWLTAGGVLADLHFLERIEVGRSKLEVINESPTGELLLDPTLSDIGNSKKSRDLLYWLKHTALRAEVIRELALRRLVSSGILVVDEDGLHRRSRWVRDTHKYPILAEGENFEVKVRAMEALLSGVVPSKRDVAIVAVAHACNAFAALMSRDEFADIEAQCNRVCSTNRALQVLHETIEHGIESKSHTPTARGLPVIGNAIEMAGNVGQFLTDQYLKLGPVYRVKILNREYTVLAGANANNFVNRQGREYLRSKETWQDFDSELGASTSMVSADGEEHFKLRRGMRDAFSQRVVTNHIDRVVSIARREIGLLNDERPKRVHYTMQRLVSEQIGVLTTGVSPADCVDDLIFFLETMLLLRVTKARPSMELPMPRVKRAQKRLIEFANNVLNAHDPHLRQRQEPDLIDTILELHRQDPTLVPETDLVITSLGPFFAGLETAATASSFLLYTTLTQPDLLEEMRKEAAEFFEGPMTGERALETFDVIRRSMMETMRLFPVVPSIIRTVSNSFDFEGYRIPAGEQVMVAVSVPHYLEEYFPNPKEFDIDRYLPDREEHRKLGAYAPFGLGAHRCLGADFAELLVMTNIATLIHYFDIRLSNPKYTLRMRPIPTLHPDDGFRVHFEPRQSMAIRQDAKEAALEVED
ncbi:MAG: cytochrome P450 [Gammaproteobacteria bacterium]|nr:cytochrome P450 [Gammaproteobacteria bacterium]